MISNLTTALVAAAARRRPVTISSAYSRQIKARQDDTIRGKGRYYFYEYVRKSLMHILLLKGIRFVYILYVPSADQVHTFHSSVCFYDPQNVLFFFNREAFSQNFINLGAALLIRAQLTYIYGKQHSSDSHCQTF